ncbi:uncharacterized protein isoform X2 [Musca autumnalis]|uniref:uncharacterized protein isoform X2 n=1 Tax=Musca autumnalis TaxID=221902 RepID=UPI003CEE180C
MSKLGTNLIKPSQNEFMDRKANESVEFPPLTIHMEQIKSVLLLLNSEEDLVLVNVLKHLTEYVRKNDENVALLKEHNVLEFMRHKRFYRHSQNVIIRRFALYLTNHILENMNRLTDLNSLVTLDILKECQTYYLSEEDDVCLEYLIVIICRCLDDPKMAKELLNEFKFIEMLLEQFSISNNPDVILNSMKLMEHILEVIDYDEMQEFVSIKQFPARQILCHLSSEFGDLRKAALSLLAILMCKVNLEAGPFSQDSLRIAVLKELSCMITSNRSMPENHLILDVLAMAVRNKPMARIFFQHNLFQQFMTSFDKNFLDLEDMCQALKVISEIAAYWEYATDLAEAGVIDKFLKCLVGDERIPALHILKGLNRMLTNSYVVNEVLDLEEGNILVEKLLGLITNVDVSLQIREEAANILLKMLKLAFYTIAKQLEKLKIPESLAIVFGQDGIYQSIDLLLSLLNVVEIFSGYAEYAILVNHIYCCLGTIVNVQTVRQILLNNYIGSSIIRALKSLSNSVKSSVCNFIIKTSHYGEFLCEYLDHGILEILITHQKHAFCVPNWSTAMESILSKTPTMKFCIRNHLSFTDLTKGHDFYVSKKNFDDFRTFQNILKEEVSPLQPILVVNFDRTVAPQESVVRIPVNCFTPEECQGLINPEEWCYCRTPGDMGLPQLLAELHRKLAACDFNGTEQHLHCTMSFIDFKTIDKKVKIISETVARALSTNLPALDLHGTECSQHAVECHLKDLAKELHCNFIPLGRIKIGCQFERAVLFKALADQVGLPCTLTRSVDGRILYNEIAMPMKIEHDIHCEVNTLKFLPRNMLRPTHVVDLMYNIGEIYPLQSSQAIKYLRL